MEVTDKELYEYSKTQLDWLQIKHNRVPLNFHDWEDLKQEIMIHIFKKKAKILSDEPFKPWVKRVIHNQFLNQLRDKHFFNRGKVGYFKANINKFAKPMLVKSVSRGMMQEEIIYEPDFVNEKTENNIINRLKEIISDLPQEQKDLVNDYIECGSFKAVAFKRGIKSRKANLTGQRLRKDFIKICPKIKNNL